MKCALKFLDGFTCPNDQVICAKRSLVRDFHDLSTSENEFSERGFLFHATDIVTRVHRGRNEPVQLIEKLRSTDFIELPAIFQNPFNQVKLSRFFLISKFEK